MVGFGRLSGWLERYEVAHPGTSWTADSTTVAGSAPDGARVALRVPIRPMVVAGRPLDDLSKHVGRDWRVGLILVRRGGFGIGRLRSAELVERKLGRRHVQGKTKAGGWSQQRFARRRDNQARRAFAAAADHAATILAGRTLDAVAVGGDRSAVSRVLADPRLDGLTRLPQIWLDGIGDPGPKVMARAVEQVRSVRITVVDAP